MESNEARSELEQLARLRRAVRKEARSTPWWSLPVMLAAGALFIGSYQVVEATSLLDLRGPIWIGFVAAWGYLVNRNKRIVPGRVRSRAETARNIIAIVAWFALLTTIQVAIGRNISWVWATVFIGVTATSTGLFLGWRNHRQS